MEKHLETLTGRPAVELGDMQMGEAIGKPMVGGIDTNACVEAMVNGKYRVCSLGKLAKDIRDLKIVNHGGQLNI